MEQLGLIAPHFPDQRQGHCSLYRDCCAADCQLCVQGKMPLLSLYLAACLLWWSSTSGQLPRAMAVECANNLLHRSVFSAGAVHHSAVSDRVPVVSSRWWCAFVQFCHQVIEFFHLLQYETASEPVSPWEYEQGKDRILNSEAVLPSVGRDLRSFWHEVEKHKCNLSSRNDDLVTKGRIIK